MKLGENTVQESTLQSEHVESADALGFSDWLADARTAGAPLMFIAMVAYDRYCRAERVLLTSRMIFSVLVFAALVLSPLWGSSVWPFSLVLLSLLFGYIGSEAVLTRWRSARESALIRGEVDAEARSNHGSVWGGGLEGTEEIPERFLMLVRSAALTAATVIVVSAYFAPFVATWSRGALSEMTLIIVCGLIGLTAGRGGAVIGSWLTHPLGHEASWNLRLYWGAIRLREYTMRGIVRPQTTQRLHDRFGAADASRGLAVSIDDIT